MWQPIAAVVPSVVDAASEGVQSGSVPFGEVRPRPGGGPREADAAREAVEGQGLPAGQLRCRAPHDAYQRLDLERPILALAEAEPVPGIGIIGGSHMGNAVAVAPDAYRRRRTGHLEDAFGGR